MNTIPAPLLPALEAATAYLSTATPSALALLALLVLTALAALWSWMGARDRVFSCCALGVVTFAVATVNLYIRGGPVGTLGPLEGDGVVFAAVTALAALLTLHNRTRSRWRR